MRAWPNYKRMADWLHRARTVSEAAFLLAAGTEATQAWLPPERHHIFDELRNFLQEALAVARGDTVRDRSWRLSFLWGTEALGADLPDSREGLCEMLESFIGAAERAKDSTQEADEEQDRLRLFLQSLDRVAREEQESAARGETYDRWSKRVIQASLP
jgi:hypothetical protein